MVKVTRSETVVTSIAPHLNEGDPQENCLVVLHGQSIGRRYFLVQPETLIGRSDNNAICLDQESVSRNHARLVWQNSAWHIEDLSSTNGTFVNNLRINSGSLRDGDLVRVGQTIFKFLSGTNIESKYHEEIYRLSTVDGLTETYNKRYFVTALQRELSRAQRYKRSLCLCMFDIDHFKKINDQYGHLAGDHILRELAQLIGQNIRRQDTLARYGGEEFAILFPEVEIAQIRPVCEKLRMITAQHPFQFATHTISVTLSLGLSCFNSQKGLFSVDMFIAEADQYLYQAKSSGRNCLVSE